MKITFLGSGSAFTLPDENYNSNILISENNKNLLYDAGITIPASLHSKGLIPQDIDNIFISHLHSDHIGGLEYIAQRTYFEVYKFGFSEFGCMKPNLFSSGNLLEEAWNNTLKGGLEYINGEIKELSEYFKLNNVKEGNLFYLDDIAIAPIETKHSEGMKSFALMIYGDKNIFITGDTQFDEDLFSEYNESDMIFQDCEFANYPNGVHAQFHQLCTLDKEIKAKMWLYHYSLGDKSYEYYEDLVIKNGFMGLVKKGQEFIF